MRALLVPSDPNTAVTVIDLDPESDDIRAAVGGSIQGIGIRGHQVNAIMCDDGKFLGMAANQRATMIGLDTGSIFPHDVLVGNVLFTGPAGEMGEDTDLPEHELKWLLALLDQSL